MVADDVLEGLGRLHDVDRQVRGLHVQVLRLHHHDARTDGGARVRAACRQINHPGDHGISLFGADVARHPECLAIQLQIGGAPDAIGAGGRDGRGDLIRLELLAPTPAVADHYRHDQCPPDPSMGWNP